MAAVADDFARRRVKDAPAPGAIAHGVHMIRYLLIVDDPLRPKLEDAADENGFVGVRLHDRLLRTVQRRHLHITVAKVGGPDLIAFPCQLDLLADCAGQNVGRFGPGLLGHEDFGIVARALDRPGILDAQMLQPVPFRLNDPGSIDQPHIQGVELAAELQIHLGPAPGQPVDIADDRRVDVRVLAEKGEHLIQCPSVAFAARIMLDKIADDIDPFPPRDQLHLPPLRLNALALLKLLIRRNAQQRDPEA